MTDLKGDWEDLIVEGVTKWRIVKIAVSEVIQEAATMTLYTITGPCVRQRMVLTAMPPIVFLVEYAKHVGATFVVSHTLRIDNADNAQIDDLRDLVGVEVFGI